VQGVHERLRQISAHLVLNLVKLLAEQLRWPTGRLERLDGAQQHRASRICRIGERVELVTKPSLVTQRLRQIIVSSS
jgi:hypothetical protein